MSYSTEKLAGEPIILHTMHADYKATKDVESAVEDITAHLDAVTEPVYVIVDTRATAFGLDDIIMAANVAVRTKNPFIRHPNTRETIAVTRSDLLRLAIRGLDSDMFGHVALKVFGTLDEALAYCRGQSAD